MFANNHGGIKLFLLKKATCPICGSRSAKPDRGVLSVLLIAIQVLFGSPWGMSYTCRNCGHQWFDD